MGIDVREFNKADFQGISKPLLYKLMELRTRSNERANKSIPAAVDNIAILKADGDLVDSGINLIAISDLQSYGYFSRMFLLMGA